MERRGFERKHLRQEVMQPGISESAIKSRSGNGFFLDALGVVLQDCERALLGATPCIRRRPVQSFCVVAPRRCVHRVRKVDAHSSA